MPGQLNQLGPQAVIFLMINADKALTLQFVKSQVRGAFWNTQRLYDGGGATWADTRNEIEYVDRPGERGNFA